jgi:2-polyprenyl-3-methyl-5-hydroxy-6-metoxy-1,4-benzoquinol methylase
LRIKREKQLPIPTQQDGNGETSMIRNEIQKRVDELGASQAWNHNYTLPHDVETRPGAQLSHGKNLVKLERMKTLFDAIGLNGKSVLDVGCNEGFFSLHMAGEGAKVIGIDIDEQRIAKALYVQSILGEGKDVRFDSMDIYSPQFKVFDRPDLIIHRGRMRALLTHGKRFLKTVVNIINGRLNA